MITEAKYGASKKEINCGGWENDGSWTKLVERKKRAFHGGGKKHEQNAFEWICRAQIADVENIQRGPRERRRKMLLGDRVWKPLDAQIRSWWMREFHCRAFSRRGKDEMGLAIWAGYLNGGRQAGEFYRKSGLVCWRSKVGWQLSAKRGEYGGRRYF